ncbi:tRNA (adenosine(37)-N6)-dimethylallyltransferase MiaA [Pelagicoccus sp. SDUM812003]|uniref:tRNA (adenosine(37)-N6)-dimethylallyltransferase MiaA n=1 Tax=Pelagicoccus sp. SDUM812003 TaxID=3041267 RepID=UPI00280E324C|nr:tRNA (adenosine(37)-N6)-dimethylallyltransferase MiaA [Pelagicoccus sp. SDUM812003]MDQ8204804.1 tRNA (adenosine(37)-N6)-dimethylallyltransferase MiaA [Pelagicoccus sp. SDUM812003]
MDDSTQSKRKKAVRLDPFFCLSGCTAVGKTELSLQWAEANDAEIVSCDSLLFYRGMDIGTAKPTAEERARVPHHLIDILEPSEPMDVGRFVELAIESIREIQSRGRKALITGGSGFYLKAFLAPVVDEVEVTEAISRQVADVMESGLERAVEELRRRNPEGLDGLDERNPRRVSKALERCLQSGRTLLQLKQSFRSLRNPLIDAEKRVVILERDTESLNRRIEQRVHLMLQAGLLKEVELLLQRGIERNPSASRSIGYRETIGYLKGEYDRQEMVEKLIVNTRRLAKKQRTWFRGQLPPGAIHRRVDETPLEVSTLFEG